MRKLMAGLAFVTAAVVVSPVFADTITHKQAKVSITVPSGWTYSSKAETVTLQAGGETEDTGDDVFIAFKAVPDAAIKDAVKLAAKELADKVTKLTWEDPKEVTIHGMKGVLFKGDGWIGKMNIDLAMLALDTPSKDNDLLVIALGADAAVARHSGEIDAIFNSITPKR